MRAANRVAILVGALAVVGGAVGGCGQEHPAGEAGHGSSTVPSSSSVGSPAAPAPAAPNAKTITITVAGGKPTGDTGRVDVTLGTPVTVTVTSDVADEIHVHGYDISTDVPTGGSATVMFTANIPGVFEVELEESKVQLLELQVS